MSMKREMNTKDKAREVNEQIKSNDKNFNTGSITDYTDTNLTSNGKLTTIVDAVLSTLPQQVVEAGSRSAGITANVANLYEAKGLEGLPLVGDVISSDRNVSGGNNLLSTQLFNAIQNCDLAATEDDVKKGQTLTDGVKSMISGFFTTSQHNVIGIQNITNDDSLLVKQFLYMNQDLLTRSRAMSLTDNEVFLYEPIKVLIDKKSTDMEAVTYLSWIDINIGDALTNLAMLINSMTNMITMRGTYNRPLGKYANDCIAFTSRRAYLSIVASLFRQMSNFGQIKAYTTDMSTIFNGYGKDRTGRFDAFTFHWLINNMEDVQDIKRDNKVIISKDVFLDVFKAIQTLEHAIFCYCWNVPVKYFKPLFNLSTLDKNKVDGNRITTLMSDLQTKLLTCNTLMSSYYQFRTNAANAGLYGDFEAADYSKLAPTGFNSAMFKFIGNIRASQATSSDLGIWVNINLDLETFGNVIETENMSAFYEESDDITGRLLHRRLVDPSKNVIAVNTYNVIHNIEYSTEGLAAEDYIPNVETSIFNPDTLTDVAGNVQYDYESIYTFSLQQMIPVFFTARSKSTSKNMIGKRGYIGRVDILCPSITELLVEYYSSILPGATSDKVALGVRNVN